jgi:hypothetical protein
MSTDKSENRPPVRPAKLRQCASCLLTAARTVRTRKYDAPTRRCETRALEPGGSAAIRGHERELWDLRNC